MITGAHAMAAKALHLDVVAVASRSRERAQSRAAELGARAVRYEELPAGADVVVVATPPQRHAADALRALELGAAVLLEKPLCRTLEEADALVQAAAKHRHRLLYAENLVYAPVVRVLLREAQQVADADQLEVRAFQGLPEWGDFTTDEWGGGALFDLGVHPLAVAMMLGRAIGAGDVVGVHATLRGGHGHGSDEHAEVSLHFASGLRGQVVSSWQAGPTPVWDAQVSGARRVVRAELLPVPEVAVNGEAVPLPPLRVEVPPIEQYGYLDQLGEFARDLAEGRRPASDAEFGREVLEVVCAAYWSAGRDGVEVPVPFPGPRNRTPLQLWRGV
jgi:predicted dehydrogenase